MFLNRNKRVLAIVQVEKEAGHVFVVDSPTSVGLILGDQLLNTGMGLKDTVNKTIVERVWEIKNKIIYGLGYLPLHSIQR